MSASPKGSPLTDSPWFWLALFGTAALVGLTAINPKFTRRQERLDRQFQVRQETWERKAEGKEGAAPEVEESTPLEERYGRLIFLSPLLWLGAPAVAALWWQVWRQRRAAAVKGGGT